MNLDLGSGYELFTSLIFGTIGMGYFVYGKKQANFTMLGAGVALMVYPYVVPGLAMMILIGIVLMAIPFAAARFL